MTVTIGSRQRLVEILHGYVPVQLVYVMARLKLAELLSEGPRTVKELSFLTRTQPHMMPRLLRGLASMGLVAIEADGRVSLTELGAHLDGGARGSLRDMALHRGGESFRAWGKLEHAVRTGESGFEAAHGDPFFSYLRNNPEAGAAFDGTIDQLLPEEVPDAGPLHPAIAMDLIMLVNFADARERYLGEYEELLDSTGFALHEVVSLPSGFSILDCRPSGHE